MLECHELQRKYQPLNFHSVECRLKKNVCLALVPVETYLRDAHPKQLLYVFNLYRTVIKTEVKTAVAFKTKRTEKYMVTQVKGIFPKQPGSDSNKT